MKNATTGNQPEQAAIDWQEVHRWLEAARTTLESGFVPSAEEKHKILKTRARALAQEAEREKPGDYLDILEFTLAYETYAIESTCVREIYPLAEITPLPGTPPFLLGIVNIRGHILCVIDLKKFFELPEKGITDLNKIIIITDGNVEFGILADAILGIHKLAVEEIETELPTLTGIRARYLKGVTRERLVVLDADKILSDKDIIIIKGRQTK